LGIASPLFALIVFPKGTKHEGGAPKMLRREFLSVTAGAAIGPKAVRGARLDELISQLEPLVRAQIPGIKSFEITYDPEDPKVPLVILAMRV